jgi:hypothetical protein
MHASNHQYPYQVLLWLLELFIKDWLFEMQQNSLVLCTQPFRDIFIITGRGNEQFFCSSKCAVWTVFSTEEEGKMIDYITTASHIHYGLTRKVVMKVAYQFAKELTKKCPNSWDLSR